MHRVGDDPGMGLIGRLDADDSFFDLWDAHTIRARQLDVQGIPPADLVATWTHWTSGALPDWKAPNGDSWNALDGLWNTWPPSRRDSYDQGCRDLTHLAPTLRQTECTWQLDFS